MDTNVHPGNVSRILELLDRERLLERSDSGSVISVDWESLIQRWSQDLQKDRHPQTFLEPRGINVVTALLSEWTLPYAITGSYASAQLAPVVAPIVIDVYVREIEEAQKSLSLRASDRIGNVRLIRAFDRVAFERTITRGNVVLACPSQIAADLLTLPKRSLDEFNELMSWMKRHEPDWRR
jgi:DNA polymerase III gamma/tau subunit